MSLVQVTTIIGYAANVNQITKALAEEHRSLLSVSKVTLGGSALPASCVETFKTVYQLKELRSLYGSTEGGIVACTPCDETAVSSIGFPAPNVQVKVIYISSEFPD